jgi:hypothetical protein
VSPAQVGRQALAPLHQVVPHSDSGSVNSAWGVQVPSLPVTLQARQLPEQPVSQQTPSTQFPERQVPALVQAVPSGNFGWQVLDAGAPVVQYAAALHSLPVGQLEKHAPVPLQK